MLSCESMKSMVLVDTRTKPMSRWATFATARTLKGVTQEGAIEYVFMGDVLRGSRVILPPTTRRANTIMVRCDPR